MRRFNHSIVVALATLLLSFSICSAQQASTTSVPDLIRYSGTLKDAQGAALSSSTAVGVTFSIYKQQDGGAAVWMETQNVTPDSNGQYSVVLGSITSTGLPDDLFSQQEQRWLGVQVQGQAEQARVLLVSVPYAFKAHEAETLGGLPPSAFVKAATSDDARGTSVNALSAVGKADSPAATGKSKTTRTPCSYLVNYIPVFTNTSGSLCNSIVFQDTLGLEINGNINLPANGIVYFGGTHVFATPPNQNLSVGQNAGPGGGSASYNVLLGPSTGFNIEDGSANTFVGYFAGYANFDGGHNTFVGYAAGVSNTSNDIPSLISGQYNTFVGSQAGYSNTLGSNNAFYGYQSGYRNTVGNQSSFFGYQAGYNSNGAATSSGVSSNTFLGYQAGFTNTNGMSNTFAGHTAGYNSTGSFNTFYGDSAGFANTTAAQNTFVGYLAGTANKTGDSNTFLGSMAGTANTTGVSNTFVGTNAGFSSDTFKNTFLGYSAGSQTTTGFRNTAVGYDAGRSNITGIFNACFGDNACLSEVGGVIQPTNGSQNTCLGTGACSSTTVAFNGSTNICVGFAACNNENSPSNNIEIGNTGQSYETPGSNQILIGALGTQTDTYIQGIFGSSVDNSHVVCVDSKGKLGTMQKPGTNCALALQDQIKTQLEQVNAQQQQQIESLQKQNAEFQQRLSRLESLIAQK